MCSRSRISTVVAILCGLLANACNSSSTSNTAAPTPVRCALTLSGTPPLVESSGGTGTVALAINRECAWSAKPEVDWISVSPASGQGESQIKFNVATNQQPVERKGAIVVNEQRFEVTQRAACAFALSSAQEVADPRGARVLVSVTAGAGCAWQAVSQVPWITVSGGASAAGPGTVVLDVSANSGEARTGDVLIAGIRFSVRQPAATPSTEPPPPTDPSPPPGPAPPPGPSPTCEFSLSASSADMGSAGGSGSVDVIAPGSCQWTARSSQSWLSVTPGTGIGGGEVRFSAGPNTSSAPRTATLTIAGIVFTVTQAGAVATPACTYALSSTTESVAAAGGSGVITVTAPSGCTWTATSSAPWLTVTAGSSGSGNGTVQYVAEGNTATSPRSASLTIAGQTVTVNQAAAVAPACSFTVSPLTVEAPASGLLGNITLTASAPECAWTASASPSWITLTGPSQGTGSGTIGFSVAENTSAASRTGVVAIGGVNVAVTQAGAAPAPPTVTGVISSLQGQCPTLTFVVSGRTVRTTSETKFKAGSCSTIQVGDDVTVEGVVEADNSLTATSIRKN
jgi:hypothetical protein